MRIQSARHTPGRVVRGSAQQGWDVFREMRTGGEEATFQHWLYERIFARPMQVFLLDMEYEESGPA